LGLTKSNWKVDGKTKEQIEKERQEAVDRQNPLMDKKYTIEYSFDDGGVLDLKVADILEKYGLFATFYIIVDKIGKEGFLTWEQVRELEKRGHIIGSHTVTHPSDLKVLYDEPLHYEIQNSKDMIEAVLGHSISKFCYPRGRYDDRVKAFVAKVGYVEARVTGKPGISVIKDKLAIPGTIHIFDRYEYGQQTVVEFAKSTIDRVKKEGGYINVWGHSTELERDHLWGVLEEVLDYASKAINNGKTLCIKCHDLKEKK